MALRKHKPTTPSERFTILSTFEEITKSKPERSLTKAKKSNAGRNSRGRITVRHRGGGHKRRYRQIDFRRNKHGVEGLVASIEYDPNRSANIALLHYVDGVKRYIVAPLGLTVGDRLVSGENVEPKLGNALMLKNIPLSTAVHNVEMYPGRGAALVRSAGLSAQVMAHDEDYTQLKLPSGEIRLIHSNCLATIGRVGNADHENISLGKAGRKRWLGFRPTVRGVAMNPVDHPMGGGEGRTSGGGHPVSPWGQLSKGKRTRSKNKGSSKFIIKRRRK